MLNLTRRCALFLQLCSLFWEIEPPQTLYEKKRVGNRGLFELWTRGWLEGSRDVHAEWNLHASDSQHHLEEARSAPKPDHSIISTITGGHRALFVVPDPLAEAATSPLTHRHIQPLPSCLPSSLAILPMFYFLQGL